DWRGGLSPHSRAVAGAPGGGPRRLPGRAGGGQQQGPPAAAPGGGNGTVPPDGQTPPPRGGGRPRQKRGLATRPGPEAAPALPPEFASLMGGTERPWAPSPDGKTWAVARGKAGRAFSLLDWRAGAWRADSPRLGTTVNSLAWSPDGRVAAGEADGRVSFWDG